MHPSSSPAHILAVAVHALSAARAAFGANLLLLAAGTALTIYQLAGYFAS